MRVGPAAASHSSAPRARSPGFTLPAGAMLAIQCGPAARRGCGDAIAPLRARLACAVRHACAPLVESRNGVRPAPSSATAPPTPERPGSDVRTGRCPRLAPVRDARAGTSAAQAPQGLSACERPEDPVLPFFARDKSSNALPTQPRPAVATPPYPCGINQRGQQGEWWAAATHACAALGRCKLRPPPVPSPSPAVVEHNPTRLLRPPPGAKPAAIAPDPSLQHVPSGAAGVTGRRLAELGLGAPELSTCPERGGSLSPNRCSR